jgi:acyl CoA:acetate/3-ketoacid CoA transferase beta subunit
MTSDRAAGQADLFIAAIARNLADGDYVHLGASQPQLWKAVRMARMLWAPRLQIASAGQFVLDPDTGPEPGLTYGPAAVPHRQATMNQSTIFNDLRRSRVTLAGCLQVDRHGNGNLAEVRASSGRIIRGPGYAGLPTLTTHSEKFFLLVAEHSPRCLVEKADKISVLGNPRQRARLGLPDGLRQVITPLASFTLVNGGLCVQEVEPGTDELALQQCTGFPIAFTADARDRPRLSREERKVLSAL